MPLILVTFEVFQLETSSDVRDWQPMNMPPMSVTCDVSQCETSMADSDLQL